MSALTPPTPVAAAKRAVIGKSLRFHWSLSQAGNTFRRAVCVDELSGQLPRAELVARLRRAMGLVPGSSRPRE